MHGTDGIDAVGFGLMLAVMVLFVASTFSCIFCGLTFFLNEPALRCGDVGGYLANADKMLADLDGDDCIKIRDIVSKDGTVRDYVAKVNLEGRKLVKIEVDMLVKWFEGADQREACKAIAMV